jgi:hypothetical protein
MLHGMENVKERERERERGHAGNENKKKLGLNHGFGRSLSPQKLVAPNYLSELTTR